MTRPQHSEISVVAFHSRASQGTRFPPPSARLSPVLAALLTTTRTRDDRTTASSPELLAGAHAKDPATSKCRTLYPRGGSGRRRAWSLRGVGLESV